MANPVGPPQKYRPEMLDDIQEYLNSYSDKDYKWHDQFPMDATVCLILDINKTTLLEWKGDGKHTELTSLMLKLQVEQERVLLNGGISSKFHFGITKMVLTNRHDYAEKVEQNINVNNVVDTKVLRYDGSRDDEE